MRKIVEKITSRETIPKIFFVISLCLLSFTYGYLALAQGWFPHSLIREAITSVDEMFKEPELSWYYRKTDYSSVIPVYEEGSAYSGLSLVTSLIEDDQLSARIISMDGELVHQWDIDWFELWPEPDHIPKSAPDYPKAQPGTHIHGALLLENGDLLFNFTNLGLVRLDACGNLIWKLAYRTHHSIHLDESGILWVPGMIWHNEPLPDLPHYAPPFIEFTVLKVSLDGEILKEISVFDILQKNDLHGLLYLSSLSDKQVVVSGDTMHLNDIETFPSNMAEGFFKSGDIMISLRNINTILVFTEDDLKVKYKSTGTFVRQHDPDFIDGNTFSVFDNFNIGPADYGHQSRILIYSVPEEQHTVYYSGSEEDPFNTIIMGNHQWLPNGNLLLVESYQGRAFEIDQEGEIVWEYINVVMDEYSGVVQDVQRLPEIFTKEYFSQLSSTCSAEPAE